MGQVLTQELVKATGSPAFSRDAELQRAELHSCCGRGVGRGHQGSRLSYGHEISYLQARRKHGVVH